MIPFKKNKKTKSMESKRDPMPNKVVGAAKKNKNGGVSRDPFQQTVTDTTSRMARQVKGR